MGGRILRKMGKMVSFFIEKMGKRDGEGEG